jgi:hypothetical protein
MTRMDGAGRRIHGAAIVGAALLVAVGARAQSADERAGSGTVAERWARDDAEHAARGPVRVYVRATVPRLPVEIFERRARIGREDSITSCVTPCTLELPRGTYRLYAYATPTTTPGTDTIHIDEQAWVRVDPNSRVHRSVGVVVLAGGIGALTLGSFLGLAGLGSADGSQGSGGNPALFMAGVGLVIAGAVAIPVGLITFLTSYGASVDVEPTRAAASSARGGRVPPLVGAWRF